MTERYGCEDKDIEHYVCRRTNEQIVIDEQLSRACWTGEVMCTGLRLMWTEAHPRGQLPCE